MPSNVVTSNARNRRWLAILLGAVLLAGPLGVVRYAPVYLPPAAADEAPLPEGPQDVFGYATLANPLVRFFVVGRPVTSEPARLEGWRRVDRDLLPDPEAAVDGRLFTVGREGLARLDRFEETGARYERMRVLLADGREAWVYRLLPLPPDLP